METIFDFVKEQRTQYRAYTIEITDGCEYAERPEASLHASLLSAAVGQMGALALSNSAGGDRHKL